MNHLNEDKLIQYAFDLAEPGDRETAQQHLDECTECRNALAVLKAKFAAMDVLADEVPPSEELIAQTLAVKDAVKSIPLYRCRWVEWSAAAAAVAIVCVLMLQNPPETRVKSSPPYEGGVPRSGEGVEAGRGLFPDDRMAALSNADQDNMGTMSNNHPGLKATPPSKGGELLEALPLPRTKSSPLYKGGVPRSGEGVVRIASADEIPDKPPFAPASAIELVVLPKPDKSQVTIYNSKDLTLVRDTRKLTLKPGWNWLQFMWDNTQIDPTSLSLMPLKHADKVDIQQLVYPARLKDIGRWLKED